MEEQNISYTDKIGLPPGSLVYIGKQRSDKVIISETDYSTEHYQENILNEISDCTAWDKPDSVTVVNVIGVHDTSIIEATGKHFGLDPMILEDIVNTNSRSKLEEFDDYFFLTMKVLAVELKSNEINTENVSLVLGKNGVILFQESEFKILDPFKDRVRKGKGLVRQRKADYIFYRMIDTFVDNYFIVTEHLYDRLEKLEEKILENSNENVNEEIYELKKKIAYVKRTISPLRECISNIIKVDSDLVSETTQNYFRDVYDHLIHLTETIDSQRETINDFLNLYMSSMSNKMNEIMKVLTIFAAIFIPLTFIAGIYGTNFNYIPELNFKFGYFIMWGVMVLVAGIMLYYFKKNKWF